MLVDFQCNETIQDRGHKSEINFTTTTTYDNPDLKYHSQQSHLPDQQATITQPILSCNASQSTNNKDKYHILSKAGTLTYVNSNN